MNRRGFIQKSSAIGLASLFSAHFLLEACASPSGVVSSDLVRELRLSTHLSIQELVSFYSDKLGLTLKSSSDDHCSFVAGNSVLTFKQNARGEEEPFYHFAFNIPSNQIKQAESWFLKRGEIIVPPQRLWDTPNYSTNVVFFRHWNAHSIFFYDPAGNIVEFIARHTLDDSSTDPFSEDGLLNISEIGLVVDHISPHDAFIEKQLGLSQYSSASDRFKAMGNEHGLLLLMKKDTKAVFDTGWNRKIYPTSIELNTSFDQAFQLGENPYFIAPVR